jgi:Zn-dependent protease
MSDTIIQILLFAVPAIIAITFHEAAHGYTANFFGDDTAKRAGRLSFNPIRHIDLFGTILLPAMLAATTGFIFGYAKPVPVNPQQLRNPRRDMAFVAAAGPLTNITLAIVAVIVFYFVLDLANQNAILWNVLIMSIQLNFVLAILNLLPLPPLDGSKVLAAFLPDSLRHTYLRLEPFGFLILLALIFLVPTITAQFGARVNILSTLVSDPAFSLTRHFVGLIGAI